jgi:anti-sigma regulatory factor (Ser/Thr protein kinase)
MQGTVQIEAEHSQDKQYVTLRISDTGPGFNHEHLEKFTSPYTGQCRQLEKLLVWRHWFLFDSLA